MLHIGLAVALFTTCHIGGRFIGGHIAKGQGCVGYVIVQMYMTSSRLLSMNWAVGDIGINLTV